MPAFLNRVFKRELSSKRHHGPPVTAQPVEPKYVDGWLRTKVTPEEVHELLRGCTVEVKTRGLSTPFLLLPFRPDSDPCAARTLIRNFFNPTSKPLTGARLQQELRLTEPEVLCSALKWCWSRLPGGVVTYEVYELFKQGELDASMARDSFATFIPISAESAARSNIIFDYFDLISAIAAHGKHNGLGGLKLSRLAGWWAFEHSDSGYGFEGGYTSWKAAADASCHLFFAYLRSLSPADPSKSVSLLPTSLRALLASVDYPPVTPPQFQNHTVRVVITVDKVSPSPFALLRRAKNLEYNHSDPALKVFTDFEDPVRALTDECRRVLKCISSTGHSTNSSNFKSSSGSQEPSWSRFEDIGFSGDVESDDSSDEDALKSETFRRRISTQSHLARTPSSPTEDYLEVARPTTPSWADFMDAGFGDRRIDHPPIAHLLPPDKILPPIDTASGRLKSSQSSRIQNLEPGEVESITPMEVDDVFWWVWMSSLAGEETAIRKAAFGRCALVETSVKGAKWLVVEEKIRGAAIMADAPAIIKKDTKWSSITRRTKLRRKSLSATESPHNQSLKPFNASLYTISRTNIAPDQTARVQAAAALLRQQSQDAETMRRGGARPREHASEDKTHSVFTLQPVIVSEATPAMQWANKYDRDNIRDAYLKGLPAPEKKAPAPETERPLPSPPPPTEKEPAPAVAHKKAVVSMIPPDLEPRVVNKSMIPPDEEPPVVKKEPAHLPPPVTILPQKSQTPPPLDSGRSSPAYNKRNTMSPGPASPTGSAQEMAGKTVSRLRAMFGIKGEAALPPTTNGSAQLSVPSKDISRKNSMRKKKSIIESSPSSTPSESSRVSSIEPVIKDTKPLPTQSPPPPPPPEDHPALKGFSSFDQGPLDDPAFVPDDFSDISEIETSIEASTDPLAPGSPVEPAIQDRWAQIRRNAAERAKAQSKALEEVSATSMDGHDDAETSGEETIESRVARIKARVAQLTADGAPINSLLYFPRFSHKYTVKMLEARLEQATVLKKVVDAIKDLVQDCNFDCNDSGIALQAMDNSHVALVAMHLKTEGFSVYRCDRNIALGINLSSLQKVLRAAQNEDVLTLKAEDSPDVLSLVFENSENDRISEYDIKLMDIDQEHLGIPDTDYGAKVTLPSSEFQRICRDLNQLSESVAIEATKEGIKFSCSGDIGNGSVTLRQNANIDKPELGTVIELQEPVSLTFSLKYLVNFCKASSLSSTVTLSLSNEIPLLIEYKMEAGHVRFYLAPKIGDDE